MEYSDHRLLLAALEFAEQYHSVSDPVRLQIMELILGNNERVGQATRDYVESAFGSIDILGDVMLDAVDSWDEER